MNDYFTFFYVKHFELPMCMKCAIQINLPCLAYIKIFWDVPVCVCLHCLYYFFLCTGSLSPRQTPCVWKHKILSDSDYCSKVFLGDVRFRFFLLSVNRIHYNTLICCSSNISDYYQLKMVLNEVWKPLQGPDSLINWKFRKTVFIWNINLL